MKTFKKFLCSITFFVSVFCIIMYVSPIRAAPPINLSTANAPAQLIIPAMSKPLPETWGKGDASLIFRALAIVGNGWFDAIAPYHPTAVGVYSNIARRPSSEGSDNYNRNVAAIYASYRVLNSILPNYQKNWRDMLTSVGLNPDDDSTDLATAIGIGNFAGNAVVAARLNDGMNQLGNEGGCIYNCTPYADYTGYKPVNTAYELSDPSRWQPRISGKNGIFTVQQFVTPQYARARPYSYDDPGLFQVPPPVNSDPNNFAQYKQQADEVLQRSASLTDEMKMKTEFFDNKYVGFGVTILKAAGMNQLDINRWVQYYFLTNMAAFDVGIAVWQEKARYDAVRPFSAIRYLYGDGAVAAWGGPGRGTVDLPASQWKEYLNVANHPEYPSGSASFCSVIAQVSRHFFGSDVLGLSQTYNARSSAVEPGITPAASLTLTWPTWTDWVNDCGESRINGGVHFRSSVEVAHLLGEPIGDLAYDFVMRHVNGAL